MKIALSCMQSNFMNTLNTHPETETKGMGYEATTTVASQCCDEGSC